MPFLRVLISAVCLLAVAVQGKAQQADKEQLGRALDYFQTEKYHECMLILSRLDSMYTLNPRVRAFLGVSYYYTGEYDRAARCLEETIPQLSLFAPQELSVYNWLCGESLFVLGRWEKAIGYYERATLMKTGTEKADALYRMGFCYMNMEDWQNATDCMERALCYYIRYGSDADRARTAQTRNMINGMRKKTDR